MRQAETMSPFVERCSHKILLVTHENTSTHHDQADEKKQHQVSQETLSSNAKYALGSIQLCFKRREQCCLGGSPLEYAPLQLFDGCVFLDYEQYSVFVLFL